jgi:hypothetical protein
MHLSKVECIAHHSKMAKAPYMCLYPVISHGLNVLQLVKLFVSQTCPLEAMKYARS